MSHRGPASSSLGAGAPLGANANNELTLSIRVACEGAECNALLEVPIPDAVRLAAPPSLVIKCAQCKRMLQVNLPSETYSTYEAQLKAQQQAALIRQRRQELATLQALQMQLQAQQAALLNNFPGGMNISSMDINFGGGLGVGGGGSGGGAAAFAGVHQNQMHQLQHQQRQHHPQLQQHFHGNSSGVGGMSGGGGGGGFQGSLSMNPGTVAALGGKNNNVNTMQPTGSYHQTLHQIPSSSSLLHHNNSNIAMLPPAQQQYQQPQYSQQQQQQLYSQQQSYQQQGQGHPGQQQQQQPAQTAALPIMPLSTPAQMPSMPSAAAVLAEQHNHHHHHHHQQQQLYQNQVLQQQQAYNQQQFTQNVSVLPSPAPASGNIPNAIDDGDGGRGGCIPTAVALEKPTTADTTANPKEAGPLSTGEADDTGERGVKRSKRSPSSGEKEKKQSSDYQVYMKDEYKRLEAENPEMSGKEAFAQAAHTVRHSEKGEEEAQEGQAHTKEENQHVQEEEEEKEEEREKIESQKEVEAGMKIVEADDDTIKIKKKAGSPSQNPLPIEPSVAAAAAAVVRASSPPDVTNADAIAETETEVAVAIEAKQSSENQHLSPRSLLLLQSNVSLSDVLQKKLDGNAFGLSNGSGEVDDQVQQEQEEEEEEEQKKVQDIQPEKVPAASGIKIQEQVTLADPA